MPEITLAWKDPYYPTDTTPYKVTLDDGSKVDASWIVLVDWKTAPPQRVKLFEDQGLYIIEKPGGSPIYAGQSNDVRGRFTGRGSVFHDFALTTAAIPTCVVRAAVPTISPADAKGLLDWPEWWLIRVLVKLDQANGTTTCQNRDDRTAFKTPSDGLAIHFILNANTPTYLNDSNIQGYRKYKFKGDTWLSFTYPANTPILL